MRIYIFKSESVPGLQAFADDPGGGRLPARHGPWHGTGVVRPENPPPHKMSRATIEAAIGEQGFQLWRIKA